MEKILKFRHNVMDITTIGGFENIKGGINNRCKDVYFVRAVGVGPGYAEEIKKLDGALERLAASGRGYYCRLGRLPKLQDTEAAAFYSECYRKWEEGGRQRAATHVTEGDCILESMLGNACAAVERICRQGSMTDSMCKNLMVKMLFWYDSVFRQEKFAWDEKMALKIVAANIEKRQEYLFFYLLTFMGCDILLLQSRGDIGEAEERLGLSSKFRLGDYSETEIPEYIPGNSQNGGQHRPLAGDGAVPAAGRPGAAEGGPVRVKIPRRETRERHNAGRAEEPMPAGPASRPRTAGQPASACRPGVEKASGAEKSFEELAMLASSVVMIAIHNDKGEVIGTGSGIMVGRDGYILTNDHVASGGKYYSVRIEEDDKDYTTDEVIKYNYVLDLAVIRIGRKLTPLPIYHGKKKLARGQKVVAIGSPLGLFNSVSDGIISGFRKIDNVDMIQFTAPTSHGSSGGAVLNMQGEVIGISTAGFDSGQNINLAVGYECINLFIQGFT